MLQLADPVPYRSQDQRGHREDLKDCEPPGSVEGRHYFDGQHTTPSVPDAVAIPGDHMEMVCSRRQMRIIGCAARTGVNPARVQPFHFVSKANLLRMNKTQGRVVDFQVLSSGGYS